MAYNSDLFSLSNWKLTLPVDASNGIGGTAVEIKNLVEYENSQSFYDAPDGAMVFRADAEGATTSGSKYARSELREMNGSERAAWTLKEGGTMTATLKVDEIPTKSDGSPGRIVVGQIHGQDEELARLYFENGSLHFVNDQAGSGNQETKFQLLDAQGRQPDVSSNEEFSYKIDARGDTLTVSVYADNNVYTSVTKINSVWQSDTFYFKAGVYLGVNEDTGQNAGQASFYGLDFSHTPGGGLGGLAALGSQPGSPVQPKPGEPAVSDAALSLSGTKGRDSLDGRSGNDTLKGDNGDDILRGDAGNDTLWGNGGKDRLEGGAGDDWLKGGDGHDTYVFSAGHGQDTVVELRGADTLIFVDGLFASKEAARAALHQTDAGLELQTGDGSSILFLGTNLNELNNADWLVG